MVRLAEARCPMRAEEAMRAAAYGVLVHADLWRRIWLKLKDLGAVDRMRVFFQPEAISLKHIMFLICQLCVYDWKVGR